MGGGDKALVALGGRPLLAHAVAKLGPQCDALALNANGDAARFAAFGLPVIADDVAGFAGPLAGVLAGLDHARAKKFDFVVSVPVDTPFAPSDLFARLHAALQAEGAEIAVAASGGRAHHVVALWSVALADDLRHALTALDMRKAESFLARHRVVQVAWPDTPFDPFFNVNDSDDLAAAEAFLHER
jgi:molybdopterin-guanine dinucleotide biosynthesis protein A